MSVELPPLPNKLKLHTVMPNDYRYGHVYGYTADQMHGYARAAVNDALALAAQECDSLAHEPIGLDENTCLACADAIRALGREK